MNAQTERNVKAREIGARISIAHGWDVHAKDGTVYRVTTAAELDDLLKQLKKMESENE